MQGFNMGRYHPPDGSSLQRKRPPGINSRGQPTIRFEMPFPIWCHSCPKPTIIGQGVRFNALKTRAGSYHSTPIWSFAMRHADCGGEIIIQTDPKNTTYIVTSGAKQRELPSDHNDNDDHQNTDQQSASRNNAFATLEKTIADREILARSAHRIQSLLEASSRSWADPHERNSALRAAFRVDRRAREVQADSAQDIQNRAGLAIDILPECESDRRAAAAVDFGEDDDGGGVQRMVLARPLFRRDIVDDNIKKKNDMGELASVIVGNTRAARDPFLNDVSGGGNGIGNTGRTSTRILGVKRKRGPCNQSEEDGCLSSSDKSCIGETKESVKQAQKPMQSRQMANLVDYDSD